jgi:hypothetical protein
MPMTINGGETVRATPAANANVEVVLPAVANTVYTITGILASYSGTPTAGRIGILSGAAIVFDYDIVQAGPIPLPYQFTEMSPNTAVTIRLFAGGVGITGKLVVAFTTSVLA